jgi:HEAT repeat protein
MPRNVSSTLRGMREPATLDLITGYVANPLDEQSGIAGLRAMGAIGSPKSIAGIAPALASAMIGVRVQALRTVRELRAPVGQRVAAVGTAYVALLADPSDAVRREAALTLGFLGQNGLNPDPASSGVNALVSTVQNDASAKVRKAAAWALGEIGNPAGRTALQNAAVDGDALVRSVATAALGRLH